MAAKARKPRTARVHNWTPTGASVTRKAANKTRTAANRKRGRKSSSKKRRRNPPTSTALARTTPKVVEIVKYRNRSNNKPAKRNPKRTKRRNGSGGMLSQFRLVGNPSLGEAGSVVKIAAIGFGGGLLARTNSAVVLALVRRFGGAQGAQLASHPVVKPAMTALAAWFLVPKEIGWMGVRNEQSKKIAQVGGILFAAADAVDYFFSGLNAIPDQLAAIVGGNGAVQTNPKTAIATKAATGAAQAAASAGLSDEQIEAAARGAAAGTLSGLEGIPSVDDIRVHDMSMYM